VGCGVVVALPVPWGELGWGGGGVLSDRVRVVVVGHSGVGLADIDSHVSGAVAALGSWALGGGVGRVGWLTVLVVRGRGGLVAVGRWAVLL